jgi:hypothetical protein
MDLRADEASALVLGCTGEVRTLAEPDSEDVRKKMDASALRQRVTGGLLREIQDGQFPSVTMMLNRVEPTLRTRSELAEYAGLLVEKAETTRYPSLALLTRIGRLLARLERAEQAEQTQPSRRMALA